jgi:hypothetical protein
MWQAHCYSEGKANEMRLQGDSLEVRGEALQQKEAQQEEADKRRREEEEKKRR